MLNIKFQTNEDIMARIMISKSRIPTDFANYLWNKYRITYTLLQKDFKIKEIDNNIILELKQQKFFKTYCNGAIKNLERIKNNWEKYKRKINLFLDEIFKKSFILNTTAIIVDPDLFCGMNIGNNQFIWGHINGLQDENYDLVYLIHESLHSYFSKNDITHTIIENISDLELAKFLNNTEKGYSCHEELKYMHINILPFWNIYLNKTQQEIERNNKINNIFYNLNDFVKWKTKVKNMNIDDFVKFLEQLNFENLLDVKHTYSINIKNI